MNKQDYFSIKAISSSSLRYYDRSHGGSPSKFKSFIENEFERKETTSMEKGTLLHKWNENRDTFIISDVEKPSETISKIIEEMVKEGVDWNDVSSVISIATKFDYGKSWKFTTTFDKITNSGAGYYDFLKEANGKEIMTRATYDTLIRCQDSINSHPLAHKLLFEKDELANIEYYNELEVYWEDLGLSFKSKLDNLEINHDAKTVILKDLKTTGYSSYSFNKSFESFKYDRQMGFYTDAIRAFFTEKGWNIDDYTLEIYMIVVETSGQFNTVVYKLKEETILKGIDEVSSLIKDIKWHYDNNEWRYTKEEIENELILII